MAPTWAVPGLFCKGVLCEFTKHIAALLRLLFRCLQLVHSFLRAEGTGSANRFLNFFDLNLRQNAYTSFNNENPWQHFRNLNVKFNIFG